MDQVLVGEVQQLIDGRWRTVLLGEKTAVRDRRRFTVDREPTFGPRKSTEKESS